MPGRFGLLLLKDGAADVQALRASLRATLELLGSLPREGPTDPGETPGEGPPPEIGEEGRIVTPEGLAPRRLSEAIRRYFPPNQWTNAARVAHGESSWRYDAIRSTLHLAGGVCGVPLGRLPSGRVYYSEESVGYFQINRCSHGGTREHWEDTDNNVRKAAELYHAAGNSWSPWVETASNLGLL